MCGQWGSSSMENDQQVHLFVKNYGALVPYLLSWIFWLAISPTTSFPSYPWLKVPGVLLPTGTANNFIGRHLPIHMQRVGLLPIMFSFNSRIHPFHMKPMPVNALSWDLEPFRTFFTNALLLYVPGFNVVAAGDRSIHRQALDALEWQ